MRLLICTQAVDRSSRALGFFHAWIEELATRYESIEVICLLEGDHALPTNVRVYSLGKENGPVSRWTYARRFWRILWRLGNSYDAVFVHQNEEYVFLGALSWMIWGKRIYMWRNHYKGSFLTNVAAYLCKKVFYTSSHSYTARYKKAVQMPVGVDTRRFNYDSSVERRPNSILSFGRLDPSKRIDVLITALGELKRRGITFTADIVGDATDADSTYARQLRDAVVREDISALVAFLPGVPHSHAADLYRSHEIFVNMSASGMLDKTIFEAALCGAVPITSISDVQGLLGPGHVYDGSASGLTIILMRLLNEHAMRGSLRSSGQTHASQQSLPVLADRILEEML